MLTHLSLFSGIGGIDLAAEWAGFETVGQCEWADYPTKVLEKHWPDVPRWRDIRELTMESFFARTNRTTVDLISGGFPCQPFSVAGKQEGENDDRYLWPMLRVIQELKPAWVLGENVAGIVKMALEQVCIDLENEGYEVQPFIIPACAVEAPHERKRVFIVANSKSIDKRGLPVRKKAEITGFSGSGENVANTERPRLEKRQEGGQLDQLSTIKHRNLLPNREWIPEPRVGRVANGVPNRVDRIKCLGNAVVPQQVYPILKAIAEIELQNKNIPRIEE